MSDLELLGIIIGLGIVFSGFVWAQVSPLAVKIAVLQTKLELLQVKLDKHTEDSGKTAKELHETRLMIERLLGRKP